MARRRNTDDFDSDEYETPTRPGQLSSNGQWLFGALFAVLVLAGLAFGVWAGASKPKPVEVTDKKDAEKPKPPVVMPPTNTPPIVEPKPEPKKEEPKPEPKEEPKPEPKKDDPKPEPKKDDPKPPPKKDDPKPPIKAVAFAEVRPVLINYCGKCHGQSAGKPKGDLDLRTVAAIKKGGKNGDVLTPGEPMKSTLYTSLLPNAGEKMPPDGNPQPTEKEIALIRDWIASGAKERRRPIRVYGPRPVRRRKVRPEVELTWRPGAG